MVSRMRLPMSLTLLLRVVASCSAQAVDVLTPREAEEVLETLPAFREAQGRGECPGLELLGPPTPRTVALQIRGFCLQSTPNGSGLIGNFEVDRTNGQVDTWATHERLPMTTETRALARSAVADARSRRLSASDAECVARQAARGSGGGARLTSLVPEGQRRDGQLAYLASYALPEEGISGTMSILVDRGSLQVSGPLGRPLESAETSALLSAIRTSSEPVLISDTDAITLALKIPSVLARVRGMCGPRLNAEFGTANTRLIAAEETCDPYPRTLRIIAVVNILNGTVEDPQGLRPSDAAQSLGAAHDLLERARAARAAAGAEVARICR